MVVTIVTSLTCPSFTSTDVRDYALDNQRLLDGHNLLYAVFGDDDYFMKNIENIAHMYKIDHKISVKCYNFNKVEDFFDQNIEKFITNASGSRIMLLYTGLDSIDGKHIGTLNELLKFTDSTTSYSNVVNVVYWNIKNKNVNLDSNINNAKEYIGDYINNINENMNGKAIAGRIHGVAVQDCTDGENNNSMRNIQVNNSMNVDSFCRSFDDARNEHEKLFKNLYILAIITGAIIVLSIIYTLYLLLQKDNFKENNKKRSSTRASSDETNKKNSPSPSKESPPEKRNKQTAKSPVRQRITATKNAENNSNEKTSRMSTRSHGKKST